MPTTTISGAGAHASAALTDRVPASKAGVKGYITVTQILGAGGTHEAAAITMSGWWGAGQGVSGGVSFGNGHQIVWSSGATNVQASSVVGAGDVGLGRNGAGVLEVNSSTLGTLRDLKSRTLITPMTSELTIASGVVTVTGGFHNIDTEADAASDDLDTINGGVDGMKLTIRANNTARTVVVKDGTGNIQIAGDMTLDNTQDTITLIYDGTLTAWLEIGRAASGA